MARVMPFRLGPILRAAGRRLQEHARGQRSLERLHEQFRLESARVASSSAGAGPEELKEQLARVMRAVHALADAHGISREQLGPAELLQAPPASAATAASVLPARTTEPPEAWTFSSTASWLGADGGAGPFEGTIASPLEAAMRLVQPPLSRGRSAMRAAWDSTQKHAAGVVPRLGVDRVRPVQSAFRDHLRGRRAALQRALVEQGDRWLNGTSSGWPAASAQVALNVRTQARAIGHDATVEVLANVSSTPDPNTGTLRGDFDIRAQASGAATSDVTGQADLRLQLRVEGQPQMLAALNPLKGALTATRSELALWLFHAASSLVYQHVLRPRLARFLGEPAPVARSA
jgi:hypothetical protein